MKRKILFPMFILLGHICNSSNLTFSNVLLITCDSSFSQTVPTGMVWEIVSAVDGHAQPLIGINGQQISLNHTLLNNAMITALPIWLPAGATISNTCSQCGGFLSIIEYNITP